MQETDDLDSWLDVTRSSKRARTSNVEENVPAPHRDDVYVPDLDLVDAAATRSVNTVSAVREIAVGYQHCRGSMC